MLPVGLWLVPLSVAFVAVGQGDAALIASPAGRTVLVDGGPAAAAEALLALVRRRAQAPLDLVVLSHRHADHLGGLERVIGAVGARLFVDPGFAHESPAFSSLRRLLDARHVPIEIAARGRRVDLGDGAVLEVLAPPATPAPPLSRTRSDVNANSVVMRLDYKQASVLFTGDAEADTERWLYRSGARLRARVLKVAHHGSNFSTTMRFLRAVRPEAAVISAGGGNDYHHPHPLTLRRLGLFGARIYRTDQDGDVVLESDGDTVTLTTAAQRAHK